MRSAPLICALTLAIAGAAIRASAAVVYDSAGFESPTFAPGNLDGQDHNLWIESGGPASAGTATVQTGAAAFTGAQGVLLARTGSTATGGDKRYWPNAPAVTPTPAQNLVTINWDMNVARTSINGLTTGPFFGVEAYDPAVRLVAAAGVDATTGEVLFADPALGGGFDNTTADLTVPLGAWNHFTLTLDFTAQRADIAVNGALVQSAPFTAPNVTAFSDADLSAIATNPEPPTQTGSAAFDNYSVTTASTPVPEPATIAAALTLLHLTTRRRRAWSPRPRYSGGEG